MTAKGVGFRLLSACKGVANAKNQGQAHHALPAKKHRKGRALRAGLLAGMGGGGIRQTLQPFIPTGRRTVGFSPP
jgi:hypothetical protein